MNDPTHYLPCVGEGQQLYIVRPYDEDRRRKPFVTLVRSEEQLKLLLNQNGYDSPRLEYQQVNDTCALVYCQLQRQCEFKFLAPPGSRGYLYLALPERDPMIVEGHYGLPELLERRLECMGIWGGELRQEGVVVFWLPAERYNEYTVFCQAEEGDEDGSASAHGA